MREYLVNGVRMSLRDILDDPEWQSLRNSLPILWRNQNLALRKLRDYVGDGDDPTRLVQVNWYLANDASEANGDQIDKLRAFCARKVAQLLEPGSRK